MKQGPRYLGGPQPLYTPYPPVPHGGARMIGTIEVEMREVWPALVSEIMRQVEDMIRDRGIKVTAARWCVKEEPPKEVPAPTELGVEPGAKETE